MLAREYLSENVWTAAILLPQPKPKGEIYKISLGQYIMQLRGTPTKIIYFDRLSARLN